MGKLIKNQEGSNINKDQKREIKNCCNIGSHALYIIISIIIILGFSLTLFLMPDIIANKIEQKIMSIEYNKVGSKENYDIVNKAQLQQIQTFIDQYKAQQGGGANKDTSATTGDTTTKTTLSQDEITTIKKDAFVEGNKDAQITIVEYSDLECPFCIRQFKDGVISKLHTKYGDKLNSIFKNYRGVPHENSEIEASATLCAGELGGVEKYSSYYTKIFERSAGGNGTGFSKDNLAPLAKELGLNEAGFKECLDSKRKIAIFDADTAEGKKLGVNGTPGNVIINNKTGEYKLIAGAYPVSEFEKIIDEMVK